MQNPNENTPPVPENDPQRFTDKRTEDRIQEHLTNEKDNISAEDISNVESNINSSQAESNTTDVKGTDDEKVVEDRDSTEYIGKDDNDKDKPKDITPWDVIG